MAFSIRYSEVAVEQLRKLRPFDRTAVLDQIEQILPVNPTLESKARLKRLRQPAPTQYRLRVGDFRVFYDVDGVQECVDVIQILSKLDAIGGYIMTVQPVTNLNTPIGDILQVVGSEGLLLEAEQARFAVLPLDDDLLDYLLERSPQFVEACRAIRAQMHAGKFHTQEEVRKMLGPA